MGRSNFYIWIIPFWKRIKDLIDINIYKTKSRVDYFDWKSPGKYVSLLKEKSAYLPESKHIHINSSNMVNLSFP